MLDLVEDLLELAQHFFIVPDVELVLNVFDEPIIPLKRAHNPPVFSWCQTRAAADVLAPSAYFRSQSFDLELRGGPRMQQIRHPWTSKKNLATWRGTMFPSCSNRFLLCSRALLAHLSAQQEQTRATTARQDQTKGRSATKATALKARHEESARLDVEFTGYIAAHDPYLLAAPSDGMLSSLARPPLPLTEVARMPMSAQYASRFLVHLDGYTSSTRLQLLLLSNSVVLKQDSYFYEYWHSALQPHLHYVPFWEASPTDILSILPNISRPSQSRRMEAIGQRASELVHTILSKRGRRLYWLTLLLLYARRLGTAPDLELWPRARPVAARTSRLKPARDGGRNASDEHSRRADRNRPAPGVKRGASPCDDDVETREVDEAYAVKLAFELESKLATAIPHHGQRTMQQMDENGRAERRSSAGRSRFRPPVVRAIPEGGDPSVPLRFESDVEKRTLPPELEHGAIGELLSRWAGRDQKGAKNPV